MALFVMKLQSPLEETGYPPVPVPTEKEYAGSISDHKPSRQSRKKTTSIPRRKKAHIVDRATVKQNVQQVMEKQSVEDIDYDLPKTLAMKVIEKFIMSS